MKTLSALGIALTLALSGSSALGKTAQTDFSGKWTCKTPPIWNGRASGPRFASGSTKEEAWQRAAASCTYSGKKDYCLSAITCWEE